VSSYIRLSSVSVIFRRLFIVSMVGLPFLWRSTLLVSLGSGSSGHPTPLSQPPDLHPLGLCPIHPACRDLIVAFFYDSVFLCVCVSMCLRVCVSMCLCFYACICVYVCHLCMFVSFVYFSVICLYACMYAEEDQSLKLALRQPRV